MRTLLAAVVAVLVVAGPARGAEAQAGVQVWNCALWETVRVGDFSGVNEHLKELKPVDIMGVRNGAASGCVVVTGDKPITGLKVKAGDLVQAGGGKGKIAAGDVMIRFADRATQETSWAPAYRFDRLLDQAPAEVPLVDPAKLTGFKPRNTAPVATVPVWVTVRVPTDAIPGDYEGTISIEADGLALKPCSVPVKLKVYNWAMPELADRRVRTIGWMSPEQVAKYYNVPLWSDKHFELMGKSMELMAELGSRHIQINVVKRYLTQNNEDTMIKWIKQADGSYKYDFTVFDKYCDLAQKKLGKPFPVRINIWRGKYGGDASGATDEDFPQAKVLVLDPATGETTELAPPSVMGSEECMAFWKPVMLEIRARMEKRGWVDVTGINWMKYAGNPPNKLVKMVYEIWPQVRWCQVVHGKEYAFNGHEKGEKEIRVELIAQSTVWTEGNLNSYFQWKSGPYPREYANYGKRNTDKYKFNPTTAFCGHARMMLREGFSLWRHRTIHEEIIMKGNDGLSVVGADMFPVKDSRGRYNPEAWGACAQGPSFSTKTILAPGPEHPVASDRFEAMREGIQLCEAMIFIQKALESKKITGDLAGRANKILDDRAKALISSTRVKDQKYELDTGKYSESAPGLDAGLYALAAEVAAAMAAK